MKYMGQGSNVVVLFTCMCSYGCFSSCKIGFVISSVRLRHSSFEQDLVDKSIIFYPKVFPLTNSSSWICWSSARRSRKRCIQATLVTTSSKQSFVSGLTHMLTTLDNYHHNGYQRWHQASTFWCQDDEDKVRPEHPGTNAWQSPN